MSLARTLAAVVLAALAAACAGTPAPQPVLPPAQGTCPGDLWLDATGVFTLRQAGRLEIGQTSIPFDGVLRLEPARQRLRAAMLGDFGLTLAVLDVNATGYETRRLAPGLDRLDLDARAAEALRRTYLGLARGPARTVCSADVPLTVLGPGWRSETTRLVRAGKWLVPADIGFTDESAGYRLHLTLTGDVRHESLAR